MRKRALSTSAIAACVLLCAGAAFAAVHAAPPGQPNIPGVKYASGAGAPYLPTTGAPRRLSGFGIGPLGGAKQAAATAAGTRAGKAAGAKVTKALGLKVGYIDIIGGIESADRAHNALRNAFQHLGAKWLYCDGAGNPTKWVTCGQSLLAQGANVLAVIGIDPSTMPAVVTSAKAKGVPIIECCGQVGPGLATQLAPNDSLQGKTLALYLKAKLDRQSGTSDVLAIDYPAPWGTLRTNQLKAVVKGDPKIKLVATVQTDPTNLVAGTQKQVSDELTADPNLKAIWIAFDTAGQVAGQVVASKFVGKTFPEKPLVATFHADPSTQPLIKRGAIDVVVDNNYDAPAWIVADATAEHFARGKPFPPYSVNFNLPGLGNPQDYQIVVKSNLPPAHHYVQPTIDTVSYFIAKWKAEGLGK